MSAININYSTLEEAWGENFSKSKKAHKKQEIDPICKLYNKRLNKVFPPYKKSKEKYLDEYETVNYPEKNYTKYYGYNDGRPYSRRRKNITKKPVNLNAYDSDEETDYISKKQKKKPKKYVIPTQKPIKKKIVHPDEEEFITNNLIDDELDQELDQEIEDEISDEEFDKYLDSDEESYEEYQQILQEDIESEAEEEYTGFRVINRKKQPKKDKNYLDIGLYTISGVILIFIMEQFIQVGMKMKSKSI